MRTERRRIRWGRVLLLIITLMMVVSAIAGAAVYAYKSVFRPIEATAKTNPYKQSDNNQINVLLLGLDDGDENNADSPRRSDTMIVASINTEDGKVNLLSIPRDTRVIIPGHKGEDKIAHACFYGGPKLAVKTVEELLQLPVHYYAAVDWQAFIKVVDLAGGANLYVEHDMNYEDKYADLTIHLKKGYQHLDGRKAGEYVRFRSDELGDIGRVQRQQRFLKALSNDALNAGLILKTPGIVNTIKEHVFTDMTPFIMMKVAYHLKNVNTGSLRVEMLPGSFATIGGLSYWNPDKEQTTQLVDRLFNSRSAKMSKAFVEKESL